MCVCVNLWMVKDFTFMKIAYANQGQSVKHTSQRNIYKYTQSFFLLSIYINLSSGWEIFHEIEQPSDLSFRWNLTIRNEKLLTDGKIDTIWDFHAMTHTHLRTSPEITNFRMFRDVISNRPTEKPNRRKWRETKI